MKIMPIEFHTRSKLPKGKPMTVSRGRPPKADCCDCRNSELVAASLPITPARVAWMFVCRLGLTGGCPQTCQHFRDARRVSVENDWQAA